MLGDESRADVTLGQSLAALAAGAKPAPTEIEATLRLAFRAHHRRRRVAGRFAQAAVWGCAAAATVLILFHPSTSVRKLSPAPPQLSEAWTRLPYSSAAGPADLHVVEVRLTPARLAAIGMAPPPSRNGQTVDADVLIGQDGLPAAIRLKPVEAPLEPLPDSLSPLE